MKAFILIASKSINLHPFSDHSPKSLISIAGSTILERTLKQLKELGISEVFLIVNFQKEKIISYIGHGEKYQLKISYINQDPLDGIGNAILRAKKNLDEDEKFILVYGDIVTVDGHLKKMVQQSINHPKSSIAAVSHANNEGEYAYIYFDGSLNITKIIEKSKTTALTNYILAGAFILDSNDINVLADCNGKVMGLYKHLIEQNNFRACVWEDGWIDIYYPWDILEANKMVMGSWKNSIISSSAKIEKQVNIEGVVHISDNAVIKSGSTILGPCFIGENTFIGNNTLIRQHTNIGPDSKVGYGTEIKNAVLFSKTETGRLSFIGDSVIGKNVRIGTNTLTLNYNTTEKKILVTVPDKKEEITFQKIGSFIGDHSVIGSSHTLPPGSIFPADTSIPDNFSVNNTESFQILEQT